MKLVIASLMIIVLLVSCSTKKVEEKGAVILLADREAPLGWVYLRIFQDSTFEFESRGLRTKEVYYGQAEITKNQIIFNYQGNDPKIGDISIYNKYSVYFTNGEYPESLGIKFSKLDSSNYEDFNFQGIRHIIQQAINLPALEGYFHVDSVLDRKPLKIVETGFISKTTIGGLKKFEEYVKVLSQSEVDSLEIKDYLIVSEWEIENGQLRLQLDYPVEGISVNYFYEKTSNIWILKNSVLTEQQLEHERTLRTHSQSVYL